MRNSGRRCLWTGILASVAATHTFSAPADPGPAEIVVAIRYLQQTGASHTHLYLYREDGKLLRQLTRDDAGQDRDPVFAPDGETIVFTRELPKGAKQWWSVEPRGGNLRLLAAAADWYKQTKNSPHFVSPEDQDSASPAPADASHPVLPLVNDLAVLVLAPTAAADKDNPDDWTARIRGKKGDETAVGQVSGWAPRRLVCREGGTEQTSLVNEILQATFISTSLGSMDNATVYAVDPGGRKLARLARNWAAPFPLPGEAAFLTFAEERYVPFGDGAHTANCSYADRWDAALKRVRYARKDAAAICGGASIYRPGQTPAVVTLLAGQDTNDR